MIIMETKKSSKADLERKRNLFFLLGLVVALGTTLLAFEWNTKPSRVESLGVLQAQNVEEEFIPITREPEVKPPPPPQPKAFEILTIVENDVKLDEELVIDDSEADDKTLINVTPVIQAKEDIKPENEIFYIVEEPAQFPGGERALYQFIQKSVKYPVIAQENGIQGKVYVKFVVSESGKVSNAEILRGVDPSLDKEALRVISSLPNFKPGKQQGNPVKVYYNAVINFQLQ